MKKIAGIVVAISLLGAFSLNAHSNELYPRIGENINVFAGTDLQKRRMKFEDNFGGNLFSENYSQYDFFAGIRIYDYIGFRVGYQSTSEKQRNAVINEGENYLGLFIETNAGVEGHETQSKLKGYYADIMGFYPIYEKYKIELFGTLGLARHTLMLKDTLLTLDGFPEPTNLITWNEKKTLGRITAGIQSEVTPHLVIRIMAGWENTARLSNLKPQENPQSATLIRTKNSLLYGLGFYLTS